jgi:hypothetical protein
MFKHEKNRSNFCRNNCNDYATEQVCRGEEAASGEPRRVGSGTDKDA